MKFFLQITFDIGLWELRRHAKQNHFSQRNKLFHSVKFWFLISSKLLSKGILQRRIFDSCAIERETMATCPGMNGPNDRDQSTKEERHDGYDSCLSIRRCVLRFRTVRTLCVEGPVICGTKPQTSRSYVFEMLGNRLSTSPIMEFNKQ